MFSNSRWLWLKRKNFPFLEICCVTNGEKLSFWLKHGFPKRSGHYFCLVVGNIQTPENKQLIKNGSGSGCKPSNNVSKTNSFSQNQLDPYLQKMTFQNLMQDKSNKNQLTRIRDKTCTKLLFEKIEICVLTNSGRENTKWEFRLSIHQGNKCLK